MASIALCMIVGNESAFIERMLESFGGAFDALCLVRAIGALPPDDTVTKAVRWCRAHGKTVRFDDYKNAEAALDWPHVDNFGAARNAAWGMSQEDFRFWADADDVLGDGASQAIREVCEKETTTPTADVFFCTYVVENTREVLLRERIFRRGAGEWAGAVHENCLHDPEKHQAASCPHIKVHHRPSDDKGANLGRNFKILTAGAKDFNRLAFELHRQHFSEWSRTGAEDAATEAMRWGEIAKQFPLIDEVRFVVLLHQASICLKNDLARARILAAEAMSLVPNRREAFFALAQIELAAGNSRRALSFTSMLPSVERPSATTIPLNEAAYGWPAWDLHLKALRACGQNKEADRLETDSKTSRPQT